MSHDTSVELWRQTVAGDDRAAEAIYLRYAEGLLKLAQRRISERLGRRLDAEDILQSAWRTFFTRARGGAFHIERSGDLWKLLSAITAKKVLGQVEFHRSERRDIEREFAPASPVWEALAREPSPEHYAAAAEQLEWIASRLPPEQRTALELRLQDCTYEEIAGRTGRAERTIRRWLDGIKALMEARLAADNDD